MRGRNVCPFFLVCTALTALDDPLADRAPLHARCLPLDGCAPAVVVRPWLRHGVFCGTELIAARTPSFTRGLCCSELIAARAPSLRGTPSFAELHLVPTLSLRGGHCDAGSIVSRASIVAQTPSLHGTPSLRWTPSFAELHLVRTLLLRGGHRDAGFKLCANSTLAGGMRCCAGLQHRGAF